MPLASSPDLITRTLEVLKCWQFLNPAPHKGKTDALEMGISSLAHCCFKCSSKYIFFFDNFFELKFFVLTIYDRVVLSAEFYSFFFLNHLFATFLLLQMKPRSPFHSSHTILIVYNTGGWCHSKSPLNQSKDILFLFFVDGQYSAHVQIFSG